MTPGTGMVNMTPAATKTVPTGVKVISVLFYIGAGFTILGAILFILFGGIFASLFGLSGMSFTLFGIVLLILGVFEIFLARGLWKGRNWARIVVIIELGVGIIAAIIMFISSISLAGLSGSSGLIMAVFYFIVELAIDGLIGGYLLFSQKVKEAFS